MVIVVIARRAGGKKREKRRGRENKKKLSTASVCARGVMASRLLVLSGGHSLLFMDLRQIH
jgi:hypothetical protein